MALELVLCVAAIILLWRLGQIGRRPSKYPPGPPTWPLVGNLFQMPKHQGHKQFAKWAEQYGPIYSLILGTKVLIVLSEDRVVKDLLDKRSAVYSSRPEQYLGQEVLSGGLRVLLMPYGEPWRKVRKLGHRILNEATSRSYMEYQDVENKSMLLGFLEKPHLFIDHLRRYTSSLTTQMTFGFRITDEGDPDIRRMFYLFDRFSELVGSQTAALLDLYPVLRKLPDLLLPMRRKAMSLGRMEHELNVGLFLEAKRKLRQGVGKPCFCWDLALAQDQDGLSDVQAGYIAGSLLQAGSETTSAVLVGFVQAMVLFPHVARKAQLELDRVCGDHMPDWKDTEKLPYIRSCIKESLRWMPTTILGVPHSVIREDEYLGYTIPKDATVILNVWAIHTDPRRYHNPRTFDPSRWNHDHRTAFESAVSNDVSERDHFTFGAGRRLCQGTHIVERSMYLAIARLLWAFDFRTATHPHSGERLVPDMDDLKDGLFVQPQPFPVQITPRDDDKAQAIRGEWHQTSRDLLDETGQWKKVPEGVVWAT